MNNLKNILKKELREMFRDTKSLAMMLIIPIMIPLLIFGMSALFESQINMPVTSYNKIGFSYELSDEEKDLASLMNIDVVEMSEDELINAYRDGLVDLYVTKEDNKYILNGEANETSSYASSLVETYFTAYKEALQADYLENNNVDSSEVLDIITIEKNLTEKDNFYASYITTYAFLFIIMAITISATYPSTDTYLSVSLSSIITGIISLILMIVSLALVNDIFEIYKGVDLMLPTSGIIFSLVAIISYSLLISGLCIAIASKCKTFKEAQSALTPLTFISFFPSMIAFMIDIESSALLSLIPFLNFTLLFEDILAGSVNILHLSLMVISSIIVIVIVLTVIIKQYKSEKVLFAN